MRCFIKVALFCAVWARVSLVAPDAGAVMLEEYRALPDRRPVVRQSFGVRSVQAAGPEEIVLEGGMSWTEAGRNPAAYRVISHDDPAYAYDAFVRPVAAEVMETQEIAGVKGSPFTSFLHREVGLRLPHPMKEGAVYSVVAQGVNREMVTAARTAGSFTYRATGAGAPRDRLVDLAVIGLRAVEPVGNGLLMVEFGPGYAPDKGKVISAWQVEVNGKPVKILNLGRITRIDTYLPVGWPFVAIPMHEVFLLLERPYRQGDRIRVSVAEDVTAGLRDAEFLFDETRTYCHSIKVNQVGYLTDSPVKQAYLGRWLGSFPEGVGGVASRGGSLDDMFLSELGGAPTAVVDESLGPALRFETPPVFSLRDAATHEVVHTGNAKLIHRSGEMSEGVFKFDHSGENVYVLDFTGFKRDGEYYISIEGAGRSLPFRIGPDVYSEAFRISSYGVFAQRCGIRLEPPYSEWHRIACHNEGIVPTTLARMEGERAAHQRLPELVDYSRSDAAKLSPEMIALNKDPGLLAYWPLNGSLSDASGRGWHLEPARGALEYEPVREIMPGQNLALGPSAEAGTNGGLVTGMDLNVEKGCTLSAWVCLPGGNKFEGIVLGHTNTSVNDARIQISASWGVLRGFVGQRGEPADIGRLSDGKWHHLALVLEPSSGDRPGRVLMYVDGTVRAMSSAGGMTSVKSNVFAVGTFSGEQGGGKFIDEVRVYGRPLLPGEVRTLSRRWGEKAIAIQASGGHHDAGDYNPRSHIEVARILMNAYEMAPRKFRDGQLSMPEHDNGVPDILDEAAWAMRLWIGLQDTDGGVHGGTESNGDPSFGQTVELDELGDYAFAKDAGASFEFAGVMAQAARIWASLGHTREHDDWLGRAERAYRWAMAHPMEKAEGAEQYARYYLSPKAYAAAELLHTTGKPEYRNDFAAAAVWSKKPDAELEKHRLYDQQIAAWAYVKCPAESADPDLQAAIRAAIIKRADMFIQFCSSMSYRFLRHPWAPITWGTGAYQNWVDSSWWAYSITGDEKYRQWIIHTCDNTLGANPLGLSYITGLGTRTVRAPLHNSRYSHFGEVVPGMQVQGPNQKGEGYRITEVAWPKIREDFASLYTFVDCHFAIVMNEGTVVNQANTMATFGLLLPDEQ